MSTRWLPLLLLTACALAADPSRPPTTPAAPPTSSAPLSSTTPGLTGVPTSITDGDTLRLGEVRVRLFGIDAPERDQVCRDGSGQDYACGARATDALRALIADGPITCMQVDTDRYGRTVATCAAQGQDLGAALVASGWALAYRSFTTDYVDEEAQAQTLRRGLWSGSFDRPSDWRARGR